MIDNRQFLGTLDKFFEQKLQQTQQVAQACAAEALYACIERSPVGDPSEWTETVKQRLEKGYEPGRYKSSWFVGINEVPSQETAAIDTSGNPSYDRVSEIEKVKIGDSIVIVNTAHNERGEYYPALLEKQKNTRYPGYKNRIKAFAHNWMVTQVDSMAEILLKIHGNLEQIVKNIK